MSALRVFSIATTHENNDAPLRQNITTQFPGDFYEIGRGHWLVAFTGTAQELSVRIGIITQEKTSIISGVAVFGVAGYYGVASRDMWEWLATKLSSGSGILGGQVG
jgi:hypothetical protein